VLKGQENPWDRIEPLCRADQCDIMLHLGDQVYTKVSPGLCECGLAPVTGGGACGKLVRRWTGFWIAPC
jgi:hypothetical protein